MDPASGIRRLGFRKWYERELIKSHGALVTCFLCGLTVAAVLEYATSVEFGWGPLSMLLVVFFAAALGWFSWRTYITLLARAERYGQRSCCPECRAYARFRVIDSGMDEEPGAAASAAAPLPMAWMRVQCRKCGAAWRMPE